MTLTKAQKYDILVDKTGYHVEDTEGKPKVVLEFGASEELRSIIKSHYLHVSKCCDECKKKVRGRRKRRKYELHLSQTLSQPLSKK